MVEERVTRVESAEDSPRSETVVISDRSGSSKTGWFVLIAVLIAAAVAIWAFTQFGGAEVAKDNAIANAADQVGDAAGQVGDAATEMSDAAQEGAAEATGE